MRYYRLNFSIERGKAKANIQFVVPEKKISSPGSKDITPIGGFLTYQSSNDNFKEAKLVSIDGTINIGYHIIEELYEFKNQVNYVDRKLEKQGKNIKQLEDIISYFRNNNKFKRVCYDERKEKYVVIENIQSEDYHKYKAYTEDDKYLLFIVSNKEFTEVKKEIHEKVKKKIKKETYQKRKKELESFLETGYVQRDSFSKMPEIKPIW